MKKEISEILDKNDFKFKKKFGQNFITDDNVLSKISTCTEIEENSLIIEIGVGAGTLTKKLSEHKNCNVLAFEIDTKLKDVIEENLQGIRNVTVVYDDFLNINIEDYTSKYEYNKLYVIANLPYYITTPIITKIIESNVDVDKMVLMMQKEVAKRLSSKGNSKDYNSLSIFVNYYYDSKILFDVSRNIFNPAPNVDSSILLLTKKEEKQLNNEEEFFKLVKNSFNQKRKNLRNNLKMYDQDELETILNNIGKDLNYRAEQLTIDDFIYISNKLNK